MIQHKLYMTTHRVAHSSPRLVGVAVKVQPLGLSAIRSIHWRFGLGRHYRSFVIRLGSGIEMRTVVPGVDLVGGLHESCFWGVRVWQSHDLRVGCSTNYFKDSTLSDILTFM